MKTIRISELTDAALDWAVAQCEGVKLEHGLTDDERYSTNWAQGGPIIERETISVIQDGRDWIAGEANQNYEGFDLMNNMKGPTALVAAMRYFVAFKTGKDTIDIPEDLTP